MKKPLRWYSWSIWLPLVVVFAVVGTYSSCGTEDEFNLFQPIAEPLAADDEDALIEEAKIQIDQGEYAKASDILDDMLGDEDLDSNEARLLYAAAKLGESELDVWSIITKILDGSLSTAGGGGLDSILDSFGESFLGIGEERENKIASLELALTTLAEAPYPSERAISNTACLFAGMLAVPTLLDATDAMEDVQSALNQISSSASSGGSVCPDIDSLTSSTTTLSGLAEKFNAILASAGDCPFLDLNESQELMNDVQRQLANLTNNVDLGCDNLPTCPDSVPNCADLFPTCVQEALEVGESDAIAGDGEIASCELVLHCTDPSTCFGS